jgi:multiple sugar transport system substrate-binding protein
VMTGYFLPSRLAGMKELTEKGKLIGGDQLADLLQHSAKPVFPEGAPSWYPEFSRTVYTNLHAAAAGSMSVADAIKAIVDATNKLAS